MSSAVFSLPVRVYIEDTDAGGIVYYVNYLKFMERSRSEFMRQFGYRHDTVTEPILEQHFQFVVRSCSVAYQAPARLDDLLDVQTDLQKLGKASLLFVQSVYRKKELLCQAQVRVGCVDQQTIKPIAMPMALYERIKKESGV